MKRDLPLAGMLAIGCGLIGPATWADTPHPLPTPYPAARYQQMSAKSPFSIATGVPAAAAAPTPGFAAQLYVDGVAHVGQSDFVAIKSRDPDKPVAIFLEVGESTKDGMKVEGVKWSDEMGKSKVDVSKGGEKATLIFDEQQMVRNAATAPPDAPERPFVFPIQNGSFGRTRLTPQQQEEEMPGPANAAQAQRRLRLIQGGR